MNQGPLELTAFACACIVAISGAVAEQVLGGQGTVKEPLPVAVVEPQKPLSKPSQKTPASFQTKKSIVRADPGTSVSRVQIKRPSTESKTTARKGPHTVKALKKALPKAVVQPRTDLMHYGMLENAQRYDPLPHAHHNGVPNPQTSDLTHDHFQELDRNQDGAIDPVERTFGRIDMDRDLHTRTLQ